MIASHKDSIIHGLKNVFYIMLVVLGLIAPILPENLQLAGTLGQFGGLVAVVWGVISYFAHRSPALLSKVFPSGNSEIDTPANSVLDTIENDFGVSRDELKSFIKSFIDSHRNNTTTQDSTLLEANSQIPDSTGYAIPETGTFADGTSTTSLSTHSQLP